MVVLTADMGWCGKKSSDIQIVYCHTNCINVVVFEQKSQINIISTKELDKISYSVIYNFMKSQEM